MQQERPWYETLFETVYLRLWKPVHEKQDAKAQVDGALAILQIPERSEILDLCCGFARHALELARRGYRVTGLDLCQQFLDMARKTADEEGLEIALVRSDMRRIPFENRFDAVINMFTAWGYFEEDEENLDVFRQVAKALRPGGKFLLDQPNWPNLWTRFRPRDWDLHEDGLVVLRERKPDWLNGRLRERQIVIEPDGARSEHTLSTATYTPGDVARMLRQAGLEVKALYGGLDGGDFGLASTRAVYLAQKPV
jgi:SAM-dependent methyltransferase